MFDKERGVTGSRMHTVYRASPFNCDKLLGSGDKCPNCGQFHLRPGYCQALDPRNAAQYGVSTQPRSVDTFTENVDTSVDKKDASVDTVDRKEHRRAKKAEYERKRRAAKKDVS